MVNESLLLHGLRVLFSLVSLLKFGGLVSRLLEFPLRALRSFGYYDDRSYIVVAFCFFGVRSRQARSTKRGLENKCLSRYLLSEALPFNVISLFVIPAGFLLQKSALSRSTRPSPGRGHRVQASDVGEFSLSYVANMSLNVHSSTSVTCQVSMPSRIAGGT